MRGCKTCRHAESHAGFIDECAVGEDLHDAAEGTYRLRTGCPLWEPSADLKDPDGMPFGWAALHEELAEAERGDPS